MQEPTQTTTVPVLFTEKPLKNIHLTISYKGTNYPGWQKQPGLSTVESKVGDAIKAITGEEATLYGSGRTDAGVHANAQSANFHTHSSVPPERFAIALNTKLSKDIRIMESCEVPEDFNSRYSAKGKVYTYNLYFSPKASPFYTEYSWHIDMPVDVDLMKKASEFFLGKHDFSGFMSTGSSIINTVRTLESITFESQGPLLSLTYKGSGFLYKMVRIITGTLLEVGTGKIEIERIPDIIASKNRKLAGITAPPQGLFLKEVLY